MSGKQKFNFDAEIQGKAIIYTVPNGIGTVLTYNPTTKEVSTRTNAELISDLNLVTSDQLGNYWEKYDNGSWRGINNNDARNFSFLTNGGGSAKRLNTGGLLTSDLYSDEQYIPANGIYSKGNIATLNYGSAIDWAIAYNWTQTQGATINWVNANFVTLNTPQIITAHKTFAGAIGNDYDQVALEVRGDGVNIYPSIGFHQPGGYAGTISFRNDSEFSFMNLDGTGYKYLRAAGYIKEGSHDGYLLTGAGGHKPVSDFFSNNADNTLKTIDASNYNDVVDGSGKIWLGNFYDVPTSTTGFQNSIGTILNINGLLSHDKTQLIFNGGNGNIQYKTSWYQNSPWSPVRTLWDDNNLPNPVNQSQLGNYVTLNTEQNIEGAKWFKTIGGGQFLNHRLRILSEDGSNPGMVFYKLGVNVGTIQYDGSNYLFTTSDTNAFTTLVSSGFIKEGSNNGYVLTGGGGHKPISDFATTAQLSNYVTIDTPQTIIGSKTFALTSEVRFIGTDLNEVRVYKSTTGDAGIVAGHEFKHYDTSFLVGNKRGGGTNSLGYAFQFSSDGGANYTELVLIQPDGNILTSNFGSASIWNAKVDQSQLANYQPLGQYVRIGGTGTTGNNILLGWTGSELQATVDATTIGNLWHSNNLSKDEFIQLDDNMSSVDISGTNLNDLQRTGFFKGSDLDNSPTNNPEWFFITVESHNNGWVSQTATAYGTGTTQANRTFKRAFTGGTTWTSWYEVLTTLTFNPANYATASQLDGKVNKSGDTMTGALNIYSDSQIGRWKGADINTNYLIWRNHGDTKDIAYIGADGNSAAGGGVGDGFAIVAPSGDLQLIANNDLTLRSGTGSIRANSRLVANYQGSTSGQNLGSGGIGNTLELRNYDLYGTNFWTNDNGWGFIQQQRFDGNPQAYDLRLQPLGGLLYYGDSEVAKQSWVNSQGFLTSANLNNYVSKDGSTLNGGGRIDAIGNITLQQTDVGGNATGFFWENIANTDKIAGIGTFTQDGIVGHLYMGWGTSPWSTATNLSVGENVLTYKDYIIWHSGNFNPNDYATIPYLDSAIANRVEALEQVKGLGFVASNYEFPYIKRSDGNITVLSTRDFVIDSTINKINSETNASTLGFVGGTPVTPYVKDVNGTQVNLASQAWVNSRTFIETNTVFDIDTGRDVMISDGYFGGESGLFDKSNNYLISGWFNGFYVYGADLLGGSNTSGIYLDPGTGHQGYRTTPNPNYFHYFNGNMLTNDIITSQGFVNANYNDPTYVHTTDGGAVPISDFSGTRIKYEEVASGSSFTPSYDGTHFNVFILGGAKIYLDSGTASQEGQTVTIYPRNSSSITEIWSDGTLRATITGNKSNKFIKTSFGWMRIDDLNNTTFI